MKGESCIVLRLTLRHSCAKPLKGFLSTGLPRLVFFSFNIYTRRYGLLLAPAQLFGESLFCNNNNKTSFLSSLVFFGSFFFVFSNHLSTFFIQKV